MGSAPTIRMLAPRDSLTYRTLRLRALAESPDAFGSTLSAEQGRPDTEWSARLVSLSALDHPLIAEADGEPVGLAWGRIDPASPETAHLYQMWVAPGHRRRGVGRLLVDAVIGWATATNARWMVLRVTCGDTPAWRLYSRAGFKPVGEPEPIRLGSTLLAQPMRLDLKPRAA